MPLWLQGTLELGQAAVLSALVVLLPLIGVWFTNGFTDLDFSALARLGGQAWLLIHGVPLMLSFPAGELGAGPASGLLSFFPLGLTLIPFFLSWRAGRRLARASYTDQLWQALLGALGAYALLGAAAAYFCSTEDVRISVAAGALLPLIAAGAGLIVGARIEAGSWVRLIGMDLTDWIARTSQHSRWAGSYVWAVLRAGVVGIVAALGLPALLLVASAGGQLLTPEAQDGEFARSGVAVDDVVISRCRKARNLKADTALRTPEPRHFAVRFRPVQDCLGCVTCLSRGVLHRFETESAGGVGTGEVGTIAYGQNLLIAGSQRFIHNYPV